MGYKSCAIEQASAAVIGRPHIDSVLIGWHFAASQNNLKVDLFHWPSIIKLIPQGDFPALPLARQKPSLNRYLMALLVSGGWVKRVLVYSHACNERLRDSHVREQE